MDNGVNRSNVVNNETKRMLSQPHVRSMFTINDVLPMILPRLYKVDRRQTLHLLLHKKKIFFQFLQQNEL